MPGQKADFAQYPTFAKLGVDIDRKQAHNRGRGKIHFPTYPKDKTMKATIHGTSKVFVGRNLKEIKRKMNLALAVDGPGGLIAPVSTGAVVHTELYEGLDYFWSADGMKIL